MHIALTNKGWFGLCPVYFGALESNGPVMVERHPALAPLMWLSEALLGSAGLVASLLNPGVELRWPLLVTGELGPGRFLDVPEP